MVVVVVVVMIVMMIVLAVHVTVLQLFWRGFANRHNFNVEVQVLTGQHVVTINHNMIVFDFGNFYRHRALIGFRHEAHANLQLIHTHEDIFRYALHQVVIILAVSFVSRDMHIKLIANGMIVQCLFQT